MTHDWPRVPDEDTKTWRLRIEAVEQRARILTRIVTLLAVGLALSIIALAYEAYQDLQVRNENFCILAEQAIENATPDQPVSPLLIASREAVGCPPLPARLQIRVDGGF